jgi:hypothetical protein
MYGTGDPGTGGALGGLISAGGAVATVSYSSTLPIVLAGLCAVAVLFLYRSRRMKQRSY